MLFEQVTIQNMGENTMEKISVVIPKKDNDGHEFDPVVINKIEESILLLAGGFSRYDIIGKWIENGIVYSDQSYRYDIVTDQKSAALLRSFVLSAKIQLKQLSMYFEKQDTIVEFL
jgi:hypothetical protein